MLCDVREDFLDKKLFSELTKQTIENPYFPLYMKYGVARPYSNDGIFFTHSFLNEDGITSEYFHLLEPIIKLINHKKFDRIQLNLYTKTESNWHYDWHIDSDVPHKGCILYLNTNDGLTMLKNDDDEVVGVRSISNRALFFEPHKEHCSTSCTDQNFRSIIIFNYHE